MTNKNVENMGFSCRTLNCLKRAGIRTMDELKERKEQGNLIKIRGMGLKCYDEICKKLEEVNG